MRLMMLGASLAQLPGVNAAKAMGFDVITCDNLPESIGHSCSDQMVLANTFDPASVARAVKELAVDGIMTMGTDQPVLTAAIVASELGLPSAINVETARAVTDKRIMKRLFTQLGIPTVPYCIYRKSQNEQGDLTALDYPVVVKPVDSQGQRGIFLLDTPEAVYAHIDRVLSFSRTDEILVETYYPSEEVTVSGWARNGRAIVLAITDRVTFSSRDQIGICLSHELPSKHMAEHGDALITLTQAIVSGFAIRNGPIYFQFLIGQNGIKVNEVACRIGGAFESQFIPEVTGFDITRVQIQTALGLEPDPAEWSALDRFNIGEDLHFLTVQLFFTEPCTIGYLTPLPEVLACEGVTDAGYHQSVGHEIRSVRDATARVGYCIVTGHSRSQLEKRLNQVYCVLEVRDVDGCNRIIHRKLAENSSVT